MSTSDNSIYPNPHAARQHSDYLEVGYSAAKTTDIPVLLYADVRSFYIKCRRHAVFFMSFTHAHQHMFFIGAVLGKALCEGMLLDVPFAHFFLLKILSEVCFL